MNKLSIKTRREIRKIFELFCYLAPTFAGLILFQYVPFFTAIKNSFYDYNLINPAAKRFIGLKNFNRLFADTRFWQSLGRTMLFAVCVVLLLLLISLPLALLVKKSTVLNSIVRSAAFLPMVTAVTIIAIIFNMMLDPVNGIFNTIQDKIGIGKQPFLTSGTQALKVIMFMTVWFETGFCMLVFIGGLNNISDEYYEAAEIDGATHLQKFFYITLPLLKRMILFVVMSQTIFSFTVFSTVYVMTRGGPMDSTRVIVYHIYEQGFKYLEMGYASAMSIIVIVVMIIFALIESKILQTKTEY